MTTVVDFEDLEHLVEKEREKLVELESRFEAIARDISRCVPARGTDHADLAIVASQLSGVSMSLASLNEDVSHASGVFAALSRVSRCVVVASAPPAAGRSNPSRRRRG